MHSHANPPWTRLAGTPLFERAMSLQAEDPRRHYHDSAHPVAIYGVARFVLQLPYDRALDLAIVSHDVIIDTRGGCEMRSMDWLEDTLPDGARDPDFAEACRHIERTIWHRLDDDPRMVLLDLSGFADPVGRLGDTERLRRECRDLHGMDGPAFAEKTLDYLGGLLVRVAPGSDALPDTFRQHHARICDGISRTMNTLSREMHPARIETGEREFDV